VWLRSHRRAASRRDVCRVTRVENTVGLLHEREIGEMLIDSTSMCPRMLAIRRVVAGLYEFSVDDVRQVLRDREFDLARSLTHDTFFIPCVSDCHAYVM